MSCKNLLSMSINIDNSNHFHKCNNNKSKGSGEWIKHLQPIFSSTSSKYETNKEAEETDYASQVRFTNSLKDVDVEDCAQHSLKNANLWAQPERQKHREE